MTNPFESTEREYVVLINVEGQHSLWPVGIKIPDGWNLISGPSAKDVCLNFIEANWKDLRPLSLANNEP